MKRVALFMSLSLPVACFGAAGARDASGPGGLFEQRLKEARQRAQPAAQAAPRKPAVAAPPAAVSTRRAPASAATASAASTRPPGRRMAAPTWRRAAAGRGPVTAPPASIRTLRVVTRTVIRRETRLVTRFPERETAGYSRGFRSDGRGVVEVPGPPCRASARVTYAVDPRGEPGGSPSLTGDLVLLPSPRGTDVHYEWDGGSRTSSETVVVKDLLPRSLRVTAELRGMAGRAEAWVPVKSGCTTTVRFVFSGPRGAREAHRD